MDDILCVIEIPKYIKHLLLSNKRRPVYYKKGDALPKRLEAKNYPFDDKGRMIDHAGALVVKNARTVGTPRLKKINGQDIYSGYATHHLRANMVNQIKASFMKVLKNIPQVNYTPVRIDAQIHEVIGAANWDLDNLWIYIKCMQDCLTDAGIIPDDTIEYVTKAPSFEFFPVPDEESRKMVFIIRKELRDVILSHPLYKQNDILGTDTEF